MSRPVGTHRHVRGAVVALLIAVLLAVLVAPGPVEILVLSAAVAAVLAGHLARQRRTRR